MGLDCLGAKPNEAAQLSPLVKSDRNEEESTFASRGEAILTMLNSISRLT